jgi:hypothetical protein
VQKPGADTSRQAPQEHAPFQLVPLVLPGTHPDPRIARKLQRFIDRTQHWTAMPRQARDPKLVPACSKFRPSVTRRQRSTQMRYIPTDTALT